LRAVQLFSTQTVERYSQRVSRQSGAIFIPRGEIESEAAESRQNWSDRQSPAADINQGFRGDQAGAEPAQPILYYYIMAGSYW